MTNNGAGVFALSGVTEMAFAVSRLGAGDLNGDGANDLVLLGDDARAMVMFQSSPGVYQPPRDLH